MRRRRKCPHCEAMMRRLATSEFQYDQVVRNLPQVFKDKQSVLYMIARLCQWAKNAENDRTAVTKARQDADALLKLMKNYKRQTKKRK